MPAHQRKQLRSDEDTQDFALRETSSRQRIARRAQHEEGLSVSPDELGRRFLSDATEQDNYEGELVPDLSLSDGPASDEPQPDDSDGTMWDQTIRRASSNSVRAIRDVAILGEPDEEPRRISLFDDENDEAKR